jgi:zinc transport system permease protein
VELFLEYFDLLSLSIAASLLVAPIMAAVGALLQLRREAFIGVAVPQFATAGVAFALWLLPFFPSLQESFLEHGHPPLLYLLPFAAGAAFLALLAYGLRRQGAPNPSVLAGGFAFAIALSFALRSRSPIGANYAQTMLLGDVLYLDLHDFGALAAVCAVGGVFLFLARRTLLVGALDAEQAVALHLPLRRVHAFLPIVLASVIGCGVMTLGPILVFSLLFLPPLAAAAVARNLRLYLLLSVIFALLTVSLAWIAAIAVDLPYGPTAGVIAGLLWFACLALRRLAPGILA